MSTLYIIQCKYHNDDNVYYVSDKDSKLVYVSNKKELALEFSYAKALEIENRLNPKKIASSRLIAASSSNVITESNVIYVDFVNKRRIDKAS